MKDISEQSEEQVAEIHRRALLFCVDNPRFGKELAAIEAAMLIGASVIMERDEAGIQLQAWQEAFGTNQLTHALARLETAERKANRKK